MKTEQRMERQGPRKEQTARGSAQNSAQNSKEKVDGFDQVFQMLKIADPAFRESLLQRLSARDTELARSLREKLAQVGIRA